MLYITDCKLTGVTKTDSTRLAVIQLGQFEIKCFLVARNSYTGICQFMLLVTVPKVVF
jgi:hypothetical protein